MTTPRIKRALLSVSDKNGIVELGTELEALGVELISTGGTRRVLSDAGIEVRDISEVTEFPEMLDGRVKTLHPRVHGGLLGLLDNKEHRDTMEAHGIESIDLVVVNLYPFEETRARNGATDEEIIEQIDIGGPAMIRSAAKNWRFTAVVTDPDDYSSLLAELRESDTTIGEGMRRRLAGKAFLRTNRYDAAIASYFAETESESQGVADDDKASDSVTDFSLNLPFGQGMRYGENPHQEARFFGSFAGIFDHLHGKELSYNNVIDLSAAALLSLEFTEPTVVIVKHTNPCGVGSSEDLVDAWKKAFATDTASPFGGIVSVNREVTPELAREINEIFTEVIVAPSFAEEALDLLRKKKNRRLLTVNQDRLRASTQEPQLKTVPGGLLMQDYDSELFGEEGMTVVTKREPTEEEWKSLAFAWRVAKHVKSNAIVYAGVDRTLGVGAGQMSRVDSAMIAARKAEKAGLDLQGSAVASDAFFPFADGLLEAVEAGATAAIQPGGSIRDDEVIAAANERGIAMVMTGMRHFKH